MDSGAGISGTSISSTSPVISGTRKPREAHARRFGLPELPVLCRLLMPAQKESVAEGQVSMFRTLRERLQRRLVIVLEKLWSFRTLKRTFYRFKIVV